MTTTKLEQAMAKVTGMEGTMRNFARQAVVHEQMGNVKEAAQAWSDLETAACRYGHAVEAVVAATKEVAP